MYFLANTNVSYCCTGKGIGNSSIDKNISRIVNYKFIIWNICYLYR